jgi:hypothetical protein
MLSLTAVRLSRSPVGSCGRFPLRVPVELCHGGKRSGGYVVCRRNAVVACSLPFACPASWVAPGPVPPAGTRTGLAMRECGGDAVRPRENAFGGAIVPRIGADHERCPTMQGQVRLAKPSMAMVEGSPGGFTSVGQERAGGFFGLMRILCLTIISGWDMTCFGRDAQAVSPPRPRLSHPYYVYPGTRVQPRRLPASSLAGCQRPHPASSLD